MDLFALRDLDVIFLNLYDKYIEVRRNRICNSRIIFIILAL